MATIAKLSNGTLLKIGDGAGSEGFTTVPEVRKITGPGIKFDLLDVSSHSMSTLFREFIPGLSDGDSIRFDIAWRPSNTVHKNLRIDAYASTNRNFQLVFPDSTFNTVLCSTYIQELTPMANIGEEMKATGNLKITGAPVWS